jgi:hypothetical protein
MWTRARATSNDLIAARLTRAVNQKCNSLRRKIFFVFDKKLFGGFGAAKGRSMRGNSTLLNAG